jgi:thymidylate synthase (FAD)
MAMKVQFMKSGVFPHGIAPCQEREALKVIEICGRTAYKSEERITEDSAVSFVLMLKKHGHLSVLEHSNIVLKLENHALALKELSTQDIGERLFNHLKERNAYHRFYFSQDVSDELLIAGNLRSWTETLQYLQDKAPEYHKIISYPLKRFYPKLFGAEGESQGDPHYTVSLVSEKEQLEILKKDPFSDLPVFIFKFICDRGISHEVVRHRVLSFTQESTRYVNYKNKGMILILPEELYPYYESERGEFVGSDSLVESWLTRAKTIFQWYQEDLNRGLKPQIARDILPNLLKTEIFVSGRWSGWKHFIELRDSPQAHPRIRTIAREVRKYFQSIGVA